MSDNPPTTPTTSDDFGCIGSTIKTFSGHYFNLANPEPGTVDIRSIAHALSNICRFGGHTPRFYSVAEHCVHAAEVAFEVDDITLRDCAAVLLHDASEAYLGDMVKPLKNMLPEYQAIERAVDRAIKVAFFTGNGPRRLIKQIDRAMLVAEKQAIWPHDRKQWEAFGKTKPADVVLKFWKPRKAERKFLEMAATIGIRIG